jgi:pimeloyl-ACP methyl ester carboxylesterase
MHSKLPSEEHWAERCAADGEFRLAARHWTGGLCLEVGEESLALTLNGGVPAAGRSADDAGLLIYRGPAEVWSRLLAPVPVRFHNDLLANVSLGLGISRSGDPLLHDQYYAAVMRAVELLRESSAARPAVVPGAGTTRAAGPSPGTFDAPVGRYVHIAVDGHDYRIYFEEAGQGVPVLLQHTAGCHGSQWRHLLEEPRITSRFRLIAYDLPFHGKSLPPSDKAWWAEPYRLDGRFLRAVPLRLAEVLDLDRPVFMGCSVGGLLALDLARRHPAALRAVIAVEGALKVEGDPDALTGFWHPQVSNEYKARAMEGLMSPLSPQPLRKETSFVYAAGWPPAFLGDLHYYLTEFDLRAEASAIDTGRVGVHILSGEYDYSGRSELGRAAHEAIRGSTFTEMAGVGHFPMSENPQRFIDYLLPVLEQVAASR